MRPARSSQAERDDGCGQSAVVVREGAGGRGDRHRLGFAERAVLLAVRAQDGDDRDWDEISAWADGIAAELVDARRHTADQSASPAA